MTQMESSNVTIIEHAYVAFARGDIEAVVAAMHDDIVWNEAEHTPWHEPGGYHGPDDVLGNVFGRIPESFPDFRVVPHRFHDAGDTVIVEGRYQATAAGTGEHLDAQVCHVWTIRDSKVTGFQQYTDTLQLLQAAGR